MSCLIIRGEILSFIQAIELEFHIVFYRSHSAELGEVGCELNSHSRKI